LTIEDPNFNFSKTRCKINVGENEEKDTRGSQKVIK